MFANNTISVYTGRYGRDYYAIHDPRYEPKGHSVYYDIDFPLSLALKLRQTPKVGHLHCADCCRYGSYNGIALHLCPSCLQTFPDYEPRRELDSQDLTQLSNQYYLRVILPKHYDHVDFMSIGLSMLHEQELQKMKRAFYARFNNDTEDFIVEFSRDKNRVFMYDKETEELVFSEPLTVPEKMALLVVDTVE